MSHESMPKQPQAGQETIPPDDETLVLAPVDAGQEQAEESQAPAPDLSLYKFLPLDIRRPEEKLEQPRSYTGPVRSESSTIGKDQAQEAKKDGSSNGHKMHVPYEGFYDIPKGLTDNPIAVARVTVADAYNKATARKNGEQAKDEEQTADANAEADEPIERSYETSYVNALEAMRTWLREDGDPKLAVNAAFDALETTDTNLKDEVISDLKGASLIDVNDQVAASDTELRLEQQLELVDAIKHSKDLTGARYTLKSGTLLEILDQQTNDNKATYKIRSTSSQGKRGGYTVTAEQFSGFLKDN